MRHGRTVPSAAGTSRTERLLLAFARGLTARPRTVLALWLVLVAVSLPFALRLTDVLTEQGASKVVPGTDGAAVADTLRADFPASSEREVTVVLQGWRADSPRMRELLAVLDAALHQAGPQQRVVATTSAYTLLRDQADGFTERTLRRAGLDGPRRAAPARLDRLESALRERGVADPLVDLVVAAQGATPARRAVLAGDAVVATDWTRLGAARAVVADLVRDRATIVTVGFAPTGPDPETAELRTLVRSVVDGLGLDDAVTAHVTGELPLLQDTYARAEADNSRMELVAYVVIILVLLMFFRAVMPAVITLVVIGLAMNVSQAWLYLLGSHVQLTQFTSTIMTFVMLGAGVDYSMLLSSRYRQERLAGRGVRDAVVHATARAGDSVLLAGAAVVLSFGATLLSPVDWIPPLGYGGLVGIPIILLAALTITPCLLVLLGDRFFWLGRGQLADLESRGAMSGMLRRAMTVTRWCPVLLVAVFLLLTVPAAQLVRDHSLSADPLALSADTDSRDGARVVGELWGESTLFPTIVAGALPPALHDGGQLTPRGAQAMAGLARAVEEEPGVQRVLAVTRPGDGGLPADVRRSLLSPDGSVRVVVTLDDPPFSPAARDTVARLETTPAAAGLPTLRVGGATRVDVEYEESLQASFWRMVAVAAGGVMVLLLFALRSVLIPVRLVLTIMMSNVWAVAVTVGVFAVLCDQPVINDLPVFLVILMMGLGMDYEIFLVTRVRDLVRAGHDDETATTQAVLDTGRVITAAGLVMAGCLGTMLLSSTLMLQQYGLGLGSAVLLDATLVRMLLVPASLLLFRRLNWWLPWFGRLRAGTS